MCIATIYYDLVATAVRTTESRARVPRARGRVCRSVRVRGLRADGPGDGFPAETFVFEGCADDSFRFQNENPFRRTTYISIPILLTWRI